MILFLQFKYLLMEIPWHSLFEILNASFPKNINYCMHIADVVFDSFSMTYTLLLLDKYD